MPRNISLSPEARTNNAARTIERSQGFLQNIQVFSIDMSSDNLGPAPSALTGLPPSALMAPGTRPNVPATTLDETNGTGREPAIVPGYLSFKDNGELVIASSQPRADGTVDRPSPEFSACIELFRSLHDFGRIKTLLTGPDAKPYRKAAASLLVEILTMRAQHETTRLPPPERQSRDATLLAAFKQLISIGLPRTTVVSTIVLGTPQTMQLSCLATYFHDSKALDLLFAQSSSTDWADTALLGDPSDLQGHEKFVDGRQERDNAGRMLGLSLRRGHRAVISAESVAEKWDDFLLRSMSSSPPEQMHTERAIFALCCAVEKFTWPLQNIMERLIQLPTAERTGALRYVYDYVLHLKLTVPIDRIVKQPDLWKHRTEKAFFTYCGIPSGPTPVHALAERSHLSETRALQLLESAAEGEAHFLAISQFAPTFNHILQLAIPVRASLHAAINARPRLAHALLAYEHAAEISSDGIVSETLTRAISQFTALLESTDVLSIRDYLAKSKEPQDLISQLYLETGLVDASYGQASSQYDKAATSHRALTAGVTELLQEIMALGQAGTDNDLDAALQKAPKHRSKSIKRPSDALEDYSNTADIKRAIIDSLVVMLDEAKQLLKIRSDMRLNRPTDALKSKWISAESLLDRQKRDRARGLAYLAMTDQVAAIKTLLAAPTPMDPYDVASAYAWALVLGKSRDEAARSNGHAMTEVFHTADLTDLSLWGMLHAALELKESAQVLHIAKQAQKFGVTLDLLQGPYASYVIRDAALTSNTSFKAVLSCLADEASQRRLFETADGAGDTLYHTVARCGGRVVETLSKKSGFRPEGLVDTQNASQLTAMEEACRVASASTLAFIWRKSTSWGLAGRLETALVETACSGSVSGLLAIASTARREPRATALLEKSLAALETTLFSAQRQQIADVLASWKSPQSTAEAAPLNVGDDSWGLGTLRLNQPAIADVEAKGASTSLVPSALLGQYDVLRQAHSPAKLEDSLARFDAVQRASATAGASDDDEHEICKHVIYNLEQRFFGQYFGRHFFAHRASVSDEQLLQRLKILQNYGSSRFGYDDAPAILRTRQRAIQAARAYEATQKRRGQLATGLFAIHLSDEGIRGSGFTLAGAAKDVAAFQDSTVVRLLIRLFPNGDIPKVVSMYPVPPQGRQDRCFEHLMAVSV